MPAFEPIQYAPKRDYISKFKSVREDYTILGSHLKELEETLQSTKEATEDQAITAYLLLNHLQRIFLAWQALPKEDLETAALPNTASAATAAASSSPITSSATATTSSPATSSSLTAASGTIETAVASVYAEHCKKLHQDLENIGYRLRTLITTKHPKSAAQTLQSNPCFFPEKPVLLVVGAGPVGCYTAAYARETYGLKYDVVLVADHHALYPTRNGYVTTSVQMYMDELGVTYSSSAALLKYVYFRQQLEPSIKHFDMAGQAICQAKGVIIVNGKFTNDAVSPIDSTNEESLAQVKIGDMTIKNVGIIIRADGFNAQYPNGITRVAIPSGHTPLRSHALQLNVYTDNLLAGIKIETLNHAIEKQAQIFTAKTLQMKPIKNATEKLKSTRIKMQLYAFLTEAENDCLERHLAQNEIEDPNQRTMFKFRAMVELFYNNMPWDELYFRQQLKLGKSLCSEFKFHRPTMPDQRTTRITGTSTVAAWAGASALPTMLDGGFIVLRACPHAKFVVDGLIAKEQNSAKWQKIYDSHVEDSTEVANMAFQNYNVSCRAAKLARALEGSNLAQASAAQQQTKQQPQPEQQQQQTKQQQQMRR